MHNFKELKIWQLSRNLVKDVYLLTKKFPDDERFGLTQQIRKAAVSIASNIAEGAGRGTDNDFAHFLDIVNGSAFETETQLILSLDLEYISQTEFDFVNEKLQVIEKMVFNFNQSLKNKKVSNPKSQISHPKSQISNPKSQISHLTSQISHPTSHE